MEEKQATKISLSTFLLIIAIIAIIVMGVFIYKLNNEKTIETQKSAKLQSQVNSLNGIVSDLQGKIGTISETINSSNSIENKSKTESLKNSNETKQNTVKQNADATNVSNNTTTQNKSEETIKDTNKIVKTAKPWGFAGSSLQEVRLYENGDAYNITYNGEGFEEKNIIHKDLIAKNVDDIESNEETDGNVILKGKNIEEINSYGWIVFKK